MGKKRKEKKAALTADGLLHKVYEYLLHRSLAGCKNAQRLPVPMPYMIFLQKVFGLKRKT